jgi:hypothetical protein
VERGFSLEDNPKGTPSLSIAFAVELWRCKVLTDHVYFEVPRVDQNSTAPKLRLEPGFLTFLASKGSTLSDFPK